MAVARASPDRNEQTVGKNQKSAWVFLCVCVCVCVGKNTPLG